MKYGNNIILFAGLLLEVVSPYTEQFVVSVYETNLKFLLEEISPRLDNNEPNIDDDAMPWSQKYKEYENKKTRNHMDEMIPESNLPLVGLAFKIKSLAGVSPVG